MLLRVDRGPTALIEMLVLVFIKQKKFLQNDITASEISATL